MVGRSARILATCLVLGVVTASSAARAEGASPARRYAVAAIGDSLTDARSHGGRFLTYLQERCAASRFDNYGRGGEMVNQMRRRFARDILGPGKPAYTHVIVYGGVNDLYSDLTAKRTPAKVAADLTLMYEMARERNIKVIAINVAPWGGFKRYYNAHRGATTLEVNRWIEQQRVQGKVDFVVDAYSLLSCGDPEVLCPALAEPFRDGIHFGPKGHEKIGKLLHESVFRDCE